MAKNIEIDFGGETALDINCFSEGDNADILWSEMVIHSKAYNVDGPWLVEGRRYKKSGEIMKLDYTTSDNIAPPNIGPGTYREALTIRISADFKDPTWTSSSGDYFTFRIWRES